MFDHDKLRVYQEALAFASWAEATLGPAKKSNPIHDPLDRARTSILLNIAEGNGRITAPDRCRFFDAAGGSALDCAACRELLAMLVGLIRNNSTDRLHETPVSYRTKQKLDYD